METMNRQAEIVLVQQLTAGDEGALAEVHRLHSGPVLGLATRLLRDPHLAEEVTQEVMLRLWRNPEKFDGARGSLRSYLLAHTHGRSIDLIRSEASRRRREDRDGRFAVVSSLSIEEEVWEMVQAEQVRSALSQLDPEVRQAIELAYFDGHTYREVATLLDTPEGTVKSRIRSGLKRLNGLLASSELAPVA